ncbi:Listeria-Bacteroides repeat domain [Bacteroidales bacterium Barb6]|nr:Listeria-Bacteroides repeat domain [Bacteroidales bacterium Barb6]
MKWTTAAGYNLSTQNPYTFAVKGDLTLQAHFAINIYSVRLSAVNGRIKSGEGGYAYDTEATVEAAANEGYHFVKWTTAAGDSLSAQNPYTFTMTGDTTLQAHFAANRYPVSLFASKNGRIKSGEGIYPYDTETEAIAEAYVGYRFVKWINEGGESISTDNPYRFVVKDQTRLVAVFEPLTGSQTLSGVNGEARVYYADGVLRLVNLAGYAVSVSTMKGEKVLQFTADGNEEYPAALPAGVYILNAAKWKERYVVKKFVVK